MKSRRSDTLWLAAGLGTHKMETDLATLEPAAGSLLLTCDDTREKREVVYFYMVVSTMVLFSALGTLGNVLTIVGVSCQGLQDKADIMILFSSFIDLVISCTYILNTTTMILAKLCRHLTMTDSLLMLKIIVFLNRLTISASFHLTSLIAVDRFVVICLPLNISRLLTSSRFTILALMTLLYVILMSMFDFNLTERMLNNGQFILPTMDNRGSSPYGFHELSEFIQLQLLPFSIVCLFTFITCLKLVITSRRKQQRAVSSAHVSKTVNNLKVIKVMVSACLTFVTLTLPYFCIRFYYVHYDKTVNFIEPTMSLFVTSLHQVAASINCVIYMTVKRDWRKYINKTRLRCAGLSRIKI